MKSVFKMKMLSAFVAVGLMMGAGVASAQVVGGGATLPQNLYNDPDVFPSVSGFNAYIGVGSGAGKRAFFNNNSAELNLAPGITVDYAGSDSLVTTAEANNYATNNEAAFGPLIQIPSVLTSVTVPYNVTGVSDLNLTSQQLALIFSRQVTAWDDPALGIPNAPAEDITIVFRQDGSGTTEILLRHLNAVNAGAVPTVSNQFATAFGFDPLNPPAGYVGVEGSGNVPGTVNATPGAIGYVSPDFVNEASNAEVARVNGNLPTPANVQAAVTITPPPIPQRGNPLAWGIALPNPSAGYSIVASTNLILSQCYVSAPDTASIRTALSNLYGTAGVWDDDIGDHGFVPLPANWKTAIRQTFIDQANSLELAVGHPTECAGRGRPN